MEKFNKVVKNFISRLSIRKCSFCNGEGSITVDSHDCWGKSECYERCCSSCGGYGFILPSELVSEIKKELGITPATRF